MRINNYALVELFGTEAVKNSYSKNKKVTGSVKEQLLNIARNQYGTVIDYGRGSYEIDNKFNGSTIVPNNKMEHPIYGKLLPSIMINVKNYHDNNKVFCLSMASVYKEFNMLNQNYQNMNSRKNTTSKIMNVDIDTVEEYFDFTYSSLKYYLESSIRLLESLNIIKCTMIRYVAISEFEASHSDDVDTVLATKYRRATPLESQEIEDMKARIRKENGLKNGAKLYGKPREDYVKSLKTMNFDFEYMCYELVCLDKDAVVDIANFYGVENLDKISKEFVSNFINLININAEKRKDKDMNVEKNLDSFRILNENYLDDFMKLSNVTIDPNSKHILVPKYKIDSIEDKFGKLHTNITKNN